MQDFRAQFPVTEKYTYLNTASCGLFSRDLVRWRHEHDLKLMEGGSIFRDLHKAHIREIRSTVGQFFSTSESNVALVPNFSFGWNTLLDGISQDKKVLLLNGDYPSVNWPVEHRKFKTCYARLDANLEDNLASAFEKHQPDVFAFSVVQYISGIKIDLNFLAELKSKYPNTLFVADGTQFLGTEVFNFEESPLDGIGASSYKWMLAGYGNGFFLIKDSAQDRIDPIAIGFNSADANFSKEKEIEFVGKLEPGHQDTLNYGSLAESIRFLEKIGMQSIEDHLRSLTIRARNEFQNMGLLNEVAAERSSQSTIFNLNRDGKLFQKLKENKIIASLRGNGIRVSFHFYNSEADLEKLLEVIRAGNFG